MSCMVIDSLVPRPHPARISLPVSLHAILKAIRTGVGFGSGTETRFLIVKLIINFPLAIQYLTNIVSLLAM